MRCLHESKLSKCLAYKVSKNLGNIEKNFPKWKCLPNLQDVSVHLFHYGISTSRSDIYEVVITSDGNYKLFYMGKERMLNVDQCPLPPVINNLDRLTLVMKTLVNLKICPGVSIENCQNILPLAPHIPVFKTSDGQPGAFLECDPLNVEQKVIRSSKCCIFALPEASHCCKACCETNHYMRTLKSRNQQSNTTVSKHKRYHYMSKDELVKHVQPRYCPKTRNSEFSSLQVACK